MSTSQLLMEMYRAMHARFGDRHWWPADPGAAPAQRALEICAGAVLTQNTNWTNVEKALANLRAAQCLDVEALHDKPLPVVAELIRPAGYYNVKAKRLKNLIARIHKHSGGDILAFLDRSVDSLREDLLSVNGIGRETADCIILYAAGKLAFVVDAYTCRILRRHKLIAPDDGYDAVQDFVAGHLPRDVALWNDYHAQLVEVGKRFCRPTALCSGCPLEPFDHNPTADQEP